jgi:hypothetical protein
VDRNRQVISTGTKATPLGKVPPAKDLLLVSKFKECKECRSMAVNIWRWLLVDRIHISVGVSSYLRGIVVTQLKGMKDIKADLVPDGKIMLIHKKYCTRLDYYPTKKSTIAEIEIGATKLGHGYFRLGLYPSKFGPGEFEHFREILDPLSPDFSYQKQHQSGRVAVATQQVKQCKRLPDNLRSFIGTLPTPKSQASRATGPPARSSTGTNTLPSLQTYRSRLSLSAPCRGGTCCK